MKQTLSLDIYAPHRPILPHILKLLFPFKSTGKYVHSEVILLLDRFFFHWLIVSNVFL